MGWWQRVRGAINGGNAAIAVIVLIGLWLTVRAQIAQAHIDRVKQPGAARDVPAFSALFEDLLRHDVNLITRVPRRVWSSLTGLVQDPFGETYRIGRWIVTGREVIVCIPKDDSAAAKAQNERLLSHIMFQIDRARGGTVAGAVKDALDEGGFPFIILPRLQDGSSIRDVFVLRGDHLRDQHCRPKPVVRYEMTELMRLPKSRFDWLWRP